MRIFSHGGKLLSLAMLGASLDTGLLNGGVAGAVPTTTPFSVTVNPSPVVLTTNTTGQTQVSFSVQIAGAGTGTTEVVALTDTLPCNTASTGSDGISGRSVILDSHGRAEINSNVDSTCATQIATSVTGGSKQYTITALDFANLLPIKFRNSARTVISVLPAKI